MNRSPRTKNGTNFIDSNNRYCTKSFGKMNSLLTISENYFWTISFPATFSQIALIQRTAVGEQITSPLGKNELKTEPDANS